jgi:hypothetical protein
MKRPIDMSVIMKNIDIAAKFMKNKEASLVHQQVEANNELVRQNRINSEKVTKTNPAHMEQIDVNRKKEKIRDEAKKKNEKDDDDKKKSKPRDLNKGRWLDIEG